jgi:hypothetical protein
VLEADGCQADDIIQFMEIVSTLYCSSSFKLMIIDLQPNMQKHRRKQTSYSNHAQGKKGYSQQCPRGTSVHCIQAMHRHLSKDVDICHCHFWNSMEHGMATRLAIVHLELMCHICSRKVAGGLQQACNL